MFEKKYLKSITRKLRKWEQLFLCVTFRPNQKHIPMELHEDIPNHYRLMAKIRTFEKNKKTKRNNLETKKAETVILVCHTSSCPNT